MKYFQDEFRVDSMRMRTWNYGWDASYFVTLCTYNNSHWFSSIENNKSKLSSIGEIVESCWFEIPKHFPFVKLGAFVVMPNHIHGIIMIQRKPLHEKSKEHINGKAPEMTKPEFFIPNKYWHKNIIKQKTELPMPQNKFGPQSKNLGSIIRGFKIGVTKNAKKINPEFKWHRNYHCYIIWNERSFKNITNYIINNPKNWKK